MDNPVAVRELRMRMRGGRAYLIMFSYVLVLSLVIYVGYLVNFVMRVDPNSPISPNLGSMLFSTLFGFQVGLVALVVPGLTAWLLTVEYEQQTVELLVTSLLRPGEIIAGKLLPALLYLCLLLLTSLPLSVFCIVFGGMSPFRVLMAYLGMLAFGTTLASVGILCSSLFRRSFAATIAAYIGSGACFVIPLITVASIEIGVATGSSFPGENWIGLAVVGPWMLGFIDERSLSSPLFGIGIPSGLVAILLHSLFALLLATAASANIPFYREDRAPWIRGLLMGLCAATIVVLFGGSFGAGPSLLSQATGPITAFIYSVLGVVGILLAPQFAAAHLPEGRSFWKSLAAGAKPRCWFRTNGAGGFWFSLVWIGSMLLLVLACVYATGADGAAFAKAWLPLTGMVVLMTAAGGSLGLLLYAMSGQVVTARAVAFLLTAIYFATASILWTSVSSIRNSGMSADVAHVWVDFISPFTPFIALNGKNSLPLAAENYLIWFVVVYVVLIVVFLGGAATAHKMRARRSKRLMQQIKPAPVTAPAPPPAAVVLDEAPERSGGDG